MTRDRQLGMHRRITRRDLIHGGVAATGLALAAACKPPGAVARLPAEIAYPPIHNGLRGAHPGSYEVAHGLAREGKTWEVLEESAEHYDLVVVGAGISGLAAAYYYQQARPGSRILLLDNHDDFGGHAKRNEFVADTADGNPVRVAWGGVFNLEYPMFSDTVNALMRDLGVDLEQLVRRTDFNYGDDGRLGPATFFDEDTFGSNVLLTGFGLRGGDYDSIVQQLDRVPLDAASQQSLRAFFLADTDILEGKSAAEREEFERSTSYIDFLRRHGSLTEAAADIFVRATHGYAGVGADSLSVSECRAAGLPIGHLLGEGVPEAEKGAVGGEVAMFPDGNASIARLLVRVLLPAVDVSGGGDVATARFDYSQLDRPASQVRIRLRSTVVSVGEQDSGVSLTYVQNDRARRVQASQCVLACNHSIIPYLCPQFPDQQKEALSQQVKRPLLLTNVLLRSSAAADRLGISGAYCPGRLHGATWLVKGIRSENYRHDWSDQGPAVMQFWGAPSPRRAGLDVRQQHRLVRAQMLAMTFTDFEREVRTVLDGMLSPGGFKVADDILAVTVNRWPHGYAYDYLDLWDPTWPPGQAPHEIARRPVGNIAIANADAGAQAYTHVAIDEAWRAVRDLVG